MLIPTRARTSALGGYVTGHGNGGISTAIEARFDETILYLQSSHGAALPARACIRSRPLPARFLETFEAFGL